MGKRISHNNNSEPKEETKPQEIEITTTATKEILDHGRESKTTLTHKRNGTPKSKDNTPDANPKNHESDDSEGTSPEDTSLSTSAGEKKEEKGEAADDSPDNAHPGLPVDRGWAWVIMAMNFVVTFLLVGYGRSLSIFFLEFLDIFEVSVASATVAFGLMTVFFGVGNMLVSHVLMSRFSTRTIVLSGALINSVSIALTALAPNMLYVTVMHCFIGFSHSMAFVPGVTLLGHYFNKRRSFALAVSNTGLSVSALVFPPLTQLLITSYGTRGALLLVAGIELQCVVAACLLRPISWYTRKKQLVRDRGGIQRLPSHEDQNAKKLKCTKDPQVKRENAISNRDKEEDCGNDIEEDTTTQLLDEFKHREKEMDILQQRSASPHFINSVSTSLPEKSFLSNRSELSYSSEVLYFNNHKHIAVSRAYVRQQSCPPEHNDLRARQGRQMSDSSTRIRALTPSVVDICGSAVNIATDAVFLPSSDDQDDDFRADDNTTRRGGCRKCCVSVMSEIMDVSLFKNWLFLLIIAYVPLGFSAGFIAFYFPSLGVEKGLSRSNAALLMTVAGGVDLVSRLSVGYLADLQLVKRTHLVIVCMTLMGLACHFCKFYNNFGLLAMFAVVYGLVGGVCNNLFAVVIIDLLGLAVLGKVMGLVMVFNSISASLNHVLIGALVDTTGSFVIPYSYVGASLFLSSLILSMEPLARRLEAKRTKILEANVDSTREPLDA